MFFVACAAASRAFAADSAEKEVHPFGAVSVSAVGRAVDDASQASGTGLALGFVADLGFLYTRFALGAVKGDEGDATTFSSALGHVSFTLAEQGPGLHFALIGNDGGSGLATGFGFKVNRTSEFFVDISPVCGPPVGAGYTVGTRLGSGGTGSVHLAALHCAAIYSDANGRDEVQVALDGPSWGLSGLNVRLSLWGSAWQGSDGVLLPGHWTGGATRVLLGVDVGSLF